MWHLLLLNLLYCCFYSVTYNPNYVIGSQLSFKLLKRQIFEEIYESRHIITLNSKKSKCTCGILLKKNFIFRIDKTLLNFYNLFFIKMQMLNFCLATQQLKC